MRSILHMVISLMLALGLVGCNDGTLESELAYTIAQQADVPLTVVDYIPRSEVPGVPIHMEPYFFFNKPADLPTAAITMEDQAGIQDFGFTQQRDLDNMGLRFIPTLDVHAQGGAMTMDFEVEGVPQVVDSPFTTPFPEAPIYNASTNLVCTRFGSDPSHANQLTTFFDPGVYPLFVLFAQGLDNNMTLPGKINLYMGPGYFRDNGQIRIYRYVGFATPILDVTVEADGSFQKSLSGAFFPMDTPDGVLLLYMVNVTIAGKIELGGTHPEIVESTIGGIVPTRFLQILAGASSAYATAVGLVELDADLNGNGTPDSATFAVRSNPTWVEPADFAY